MKRLTLTIGVHLDRLTDQSIDVIIYTYTAKGYNMAGKAKSIYLTIHPKGTFTTAFHKVFFEAKAYNEYVKTDEFKAKWPADKFDIIKETY